MSLSLVAPAATLKRKLDHRSAFYETAFALRDAVRGTRLQPGYESLFEACSKWWQWYDARIVYLERTLRAALASDALDDEQRAAVLRGLHGDRAATAKDARLLSDTETDLIRCYRALGNADRQMLRTLFARLAVASKATDEATR